MEYKMDFQASETYLQDQINKIGFGFSSVKFSRNLCDSVTIRWSIEARDEWKNGIVQNSLGGILFIHSEGRYEGDTEGSYHFDYTNWRSGYKFRRAKNKDLKKLCDNIVKQLTTKFNELS
jgi:hypothetical protein